jgi:hypothetical protein
MSNAFENNATTADVEKVGPEGLIHSLPGWVNWMWALFGVTWFTLAYVEVTNPVNRSWLSMGYATIGLGLALIYVAYYYAYQSPRMGEAIRSGKTEGETAVIIRVAWTTNVFMRVVIIVYAVWFAIALTQYVRIDGKGEASLDYLISNPDADANMTGTDLLTFIRHERQLSVGFIASILAFIFGTIAWGLDAQTMILYVMSGGNLRRGYGGNGDYALGAHTTTGSVGLANQMKGTQRV